MNAQTPNPDDSVKRWESDAPAPEPSFAGSAYVPPAYQPKKSNKKVWIIVIIALLLLCCCVLIIGGIVATTMFGENGPYQLDLTLLQGFLRLI